MLGSAYSLIGTIFVQIFGIGHSIILARLLGPHDLGILTILTRIGLVVTPLTIFSINIALTKFIAEYHKKDDYSLNKLISTAIILVLFFSIITSIILFLLSDIIANNIYSEPKIGLFIKINATFLALNGLTLIGNAVLRGFQRIKLVSFVNVVINGLNLPIYFIFILKMGLLGAVLAGVVSLFVNLIITSWLVNGTLQIENVKINILVDKKISRNLIVFSFPLLLSVLVLRPSDLFAISYLSQAIGFESAGLYRIATGLSRLILFIPSSFTLPLLPMFSELYASNSYAKNKLTRIIKLTILLCLPLSLFIGLTSKYIIFLLYGTQYVNAAYLTYILSITAFIDSITIVIVTLLHGTGRTYQALVIDVYQGIVTIIGSYCLISMFGLIGIGYTMLLKLSLLAPLLIFYLARRSEIEISLLKMPTLIALILISLSYLLIIYFNFIYLIIFIILIIIIEFLTLSDDDKSLIYRQIKKLKFKF